MDTWIRRGNNRAVPEEMQVSYSYKYRTTQARKNQFFASAKKTNLPLFESRWNKQRLIVFELNDQRVCNVVLKLVTRLYFGSFETAVFFEFTNEMQRIAVLKAQMDVLRKHRAASRIRRAVSFVPGVANCVDL